MKRMDVGPHTAFVKPMINPLLLLDASWMTRIMASVITPPPPIPDKMRPMMKGRKLCACDVTTAPTEKKNEVNMIMAPGEKIMASRPSSGATDAWLMRYELVNHIALS